MESISCLRRIRAGHRAALGAIVFFLAAVANLRGQAWQPLAQDFTVVYASPDPDHLYAYSPGLCLNPDGSLVATFDLGGPAAEKLSGDVFARQLNGVPSHWQGRVLLSGDKGQTWHQSVSFPFIHARPFLAGHSLYVLGQADDLMIIRSDDGGKSWSEPARLTSGQTWHQAPANVHYANGCVYLVMERRVSQKISGWYVGEIAPVLMRAKVGADLTKRESWTFAGELAFRETIDLPHMDYAGIPFFPTASDRAVEVAKGRKMAPPGWLETNVVQIVDPHHLWFDPSGRTFHLWSRAHTGGAGYAAITKVIETGPRPGEGEMVTQLETVPSGKSVVFVPCPGGQMKFHIVYDGREGLYWLLGTQATDSMTRPEDLPTGRHGLPNNERRVLQLHYSLNMIDWCFAGVVAAGTSDTESRHYASMVIDGDNLLVLSRSGDSHARNAHDVNLITLHTVKNFRKLVAPWIKTSRQSAQPIPLP